MSTTAARRRTARPGAVAELHRRLTATRRTRLLLWAGLLHRLARALAAISDELARHQRTRAAGPARGQPLLGGLRRGSPLPRPPTTGPSPQDLAAAIECHHRSLSRADVLTGAAAPHEVGWPAGTAPQPAGTGRPAGTWANATRTRGRARPGPSRCLVRHRAAPRALRYEAAARCSPTGPWRSLR